MSSCLRMRGGSAIRHADRLANSVRSLSRHSPYASSLARVRLSASSHRPHAILYAHGSLLHAKSLSHTVFLLGQAEQFDSSCGATRLDALAPTLSYVRMPLSCLIIFSVHYFMHEVRCIPTYAELCLRRFKAPSPILCGALREGKVHGPHFRSPSEVHSARRFTLQSQHLQFSVEKGCHCLLTLLQRFNAV